MTSYSIWKVLDIQIGPDDLVFHMEGLDIQIGPDDLVFHMEGLDIQIGLDDLVFHMGGHLFRYYPGSILLNLNVLVSIVSTVLSHYPLAKY